MKLLTVGSVLALGVLAWSCASKPDKKPFDINADRQSLVPQYTLEYEMADLKEHKKILLTNFVVEVEHEYSKHGGSVYARNRSKATIKLDGLSDEAMQEVTNKTYDYVVKKLTEMGYEVVTPDKLAENKYYKNLAEKAEKENPYKSWQSSTGESTIYSAYKYPFMMPVVDQMGKRGGSLTNVGKTLSFFSKPVNYKEQELADEEELPVLKVWLSVGFGDLRNSGNTARTKAQFFIRGQGESRFAFRFPDDGLNFGPFGGPEKDQPRDGKHLVNLTQDIVAEESFLTEDVSSNSGFASMEFGMTADPQKFAAISEKYLTIASDLLLMKLKQSVK